LGSGINLNDRAHCIIFRSKFFFNQHSVLAQFFIFVRVYLDIRAAQMYDCES